LFVLARARDGIAAIAIEGKVAEPFGPLVRDWLTSNRSRTEGASKCAPSKGKRTRLDFLASSLGLHPDDLADLRYQLVHRSVSALIEARRFSAEYAVMLVHSFSEAADGFGDYESFARALHSDPPPARDQLTRAQVPGNIPLYLGWATGEPAFIA
jgi:hypothetical protein